MQQKAFSFWGLCPPDSLTRGSASRLHLGIAPIPQYIPPVPTISSNLECLDKTPSVLH